jgi:RND family efflux transporter MFP subunit
MIVAVLVVIVLQASSPDEEFVPLAFGDLPKPAAPIEIAPENVTVSVQTYGTVTASLQTNIQSEVVGRVISVSDKLQPGAFFKKGELLLKIDDTEYVKALADAEQSQAKAAYEFAHEKALSQQARENLATLSDASATDLALRLPQLAMAQKGLDAADAKVAAAKQALSRTTVVAPYDSYIISRNVNFGDLTKFGDPLVHLFAGNDVLIEAPLSKKDTELIQTVTAHNKNSGEADANDTGQQPITTASLLSASGALLQTVPIELFSWGEFREAQTQSQTAIFKAKNWSTETGLALKPGSMVKLDIAIGTVHDAYRIPLTHIKNSSVSVLDSDQSALETDIDVILRTHTHAVARIDGFNAPLVLTNRSRVSGNRPTTPSGNLATSAALNTSSQYDSNEDFSQ